MNCLRSSHLLSWNLTTHLGLGSYLGHSVASNLWILRPVLFSWSVVVLKTFPKGDCGGFCSPCKYLHFPFKEVEPIPPKQKEWPPVQVQRVPRNLGNWMVKCIYLLTQVSDTLSSRFSGYIFLSGSQLWCKRPVYAQNSTFSGVLLFCFFKNKAFVLE